ncbi:MAG: type IV pilus assembly protein PilM, partial [Chlamydiales bacterium]
KRTVIVDFSRGSIKMALAETAGEAARFRGITSIVMPREDDKSEANDSGWIAARIKEAVQRQGWAGMPCACLLSGSATSTQSFQFPAMPEADMRSAIELKLEETLHFELEEARFDFRTIREYEQNGNPHVLVLVAAARKDAVSSALETLRSAGLVPIAIGASAESLANLASLTDLCDEESTVHVDMGSESTILNLFEGRSLRFSREVDLGGEAITQAFMRPIIAPEGVVRLTHEQAEELKMFAGYPSDAEDIRLPYGLSPASVQPLIEPVLQRLAGEIRRSSSYLCSMLKSNRVDRILLTGSSARLKNLDTWMSEVLDTPITCSDPIARAIAHWRLAVCDQSSTASASFAAILGYSLGNHKPINLMPRGERVRQSLQQTAEGFRRLTLIAAGIGLCFAIAAVPIHIKYEQAEAQYRSTHFGQQQRIEVFNQESGRETEERLAATLLTQTRGLVPNWTGIMKELAAILPDSVQLLSLNIDRTQAGIEIELSGSIPPGDKSFGDSLAELANALGASPFFHKVRHLEAETPTGSTPGEFEALLEIAAGVPQPWEVKQ